MSLRKVGIVGIGNVGKAAASAILHENVTDELYISDIDEQRAEGEVWDFADSIEMTSSRTRVVQVPLEGLAVCDTILITVMDRSIIPNGIRLDLLKGTSAIIYDIVPRLRRAGFKGVYVVVTNPCDIITYLVYRLSGLPRARVVGTGTALDSMRLRRHLSRALGGIDPRSISAYMMGEHGDSQFAAWSHVRIGGQPIDDYEAENKQRFGMLDRNKIEDTARHIGWEIHKRKGSTQFGIGNQLAFFARTILNNAHTVTPASVILSGEYGLNHLAIGVPIVLGRSGVEEILHFHLDERERRAFANSAATIKGYIKQAISENEHAKKV